MTSSRFGKKQRGRNKSSTSKQYHSINTITIVLVPVILLLYCFYLYRLLDNFHEDNVNIVGVPVSPSSFSGTRSHNIIASIDDASSSHNLSSRAVLLIAAAPFHSSRVVSIWSQLECLTGNIDKVIITAADYTKELLDPFVAEAVKSIPHLHNGDVQVEIEYYKNNNYDLGLWCDALNGTGQGINGMNKSIVHDFDHFILTNDSILAISRNTEIIDIMRSKHLTMGSLTYSLLDGYWLEANYRAFNVEGVKKLMNHTCVPNHCLTLRSVHRRHRCMVQKYEIPIAGLFNRKDVWGIYHADAPIEYYNATAKNKVLQTSPMWHSNYPYWNEVLRAKQNFPIAKISNRRMLIEMKKKNLVDLKRCLVNMGPKAHEIKMKFDALMNNTISMNQKQYIKAGDIGVKKASDKDSFDNNIFNL